LWRRLSSWIKNIPVSIKTGALLICSSYKLPTGKDDKTVCCLRLSQLSALDSWATKTRSSRTQMMSHIRSHIQSPGPRDSSRNETVPTYVSSFPFVAGIILTVHLSHLLIWLNGNGNGNRGIGSGICSKPSADVWKINSHHFPFS